MAVEKIMTFKSGMFVFSDSFSPEAILPLEVEINLLFDSLRELPILPDQAKSFEQELIHRSIFSTAAIEGNPLRETEVSAIIDKEHTESAKEIKEIEIINLSQAYQTVEKESKTVHFKITEQFVKNLHKIITANTKYDSCIPGAYRNHIVKVGDKAHGGVTTPPKCLADIKDLMGAFIKWFQKIDHNNKYSPVFKAALAHYHLAQIHPFADGNGRVARLTEAALLKKYGIRYLPEMLSNYYYREIDEYYRAFSKCKKSKNTDITPFIIFVLKGALSSLKEVKRHISYYLKESALKNYYNKLREQKAVSQRQLELLNLLLSSSPKTTITIQSIQRELPFRTLYVQVSDRTARRDIIKLDEAGLLVQKNGEFHLDREILNAL